MAVNTLKGLRAKAALFTLKVGKGVTVGLLP